MAEKFCVFVDSLNEWTGRIFSWLILPFTLIVVMDVFTRYVLSKPWYYIDINVQVMGILTAMGAGYCYLHNGHVSVDILVTHFSPRKRAILDALLFPLVLVALGPLLWQVAGNAVFSVQTSQHFIATIPLPIYPYKIILVVGISLMLLQGISKFVHNLRVVFPARSGGNL